LRILTLNRPDRRNALTYPMLNRYFDLLDEADDDTYVRAIVVTGAGESFCVGMDTSSLSDSVEQGLSRRPGKGRRMTHALSIRKPIIGAINGACAGFGFVQMLHFDVRFAVEGTVFATAFVRRGLNAEYGSSWLLPRIVGHARATELLLSGRRFDATEAERIGLVHRVVTRAELMDAACDYARELAEQCSPTAVAATKLQLLGDWGRDHDEAEDFAKALSHTGDNRIDFREGVRSYVERRPPRFAPLPPRDPSPPSD
jgi:enoyl-CoA hydratase/carnithine racemase